MQCTYVCLCTCGNLKLFEWQLRSRGNKKGACIFMGFCVCTPKSKMKYKLTEIVPL